MPPIADIGSKWKPTKVTSLPSWKDERLVAIDIETCDPDLRKLGPGPRRGGYIAGFSIAIEGGPCFYCPLAHENDPANDRRYLDWLRENAQAFRGTLVNANISYDLDFLESAGVTFPQVEAIRDVLIADPLINQNLFHYSLDHVAERWLQGRKKDERHLREAAAVWGVDPKAEMWKLPARHVAEYAMEDVRLVLDIWHEQLDRIGKEDIWEIFNLESDLTPVLVKIRRRGVRINERQIEIVERYTAEQEFQALARVKHATGIQVDVNDAKTIASAIKTLDVPRLTKFTNTGRESWDAEVLKSIKHPVAESILHAKRVNKVRTTFCDTIRRHQVRGRIHCTLHQIRTERDTGELEGTGFGRASCTNPNLQQLPARDPILGPMLRAVMVPEDGELWCSADFSGQEPRWIVDYAVKTKCPGADEILAAYLENPKLDLHQKTADLAGIKRKDAKTIFLGLAYGMGGMKLCKSLGYPSLKEENLKAWKERIARDRYEQEKNPSKFSHVKNWETYDYPGTKGRELVERFNAMVPFLKALQRKASAAADKNLMVRTIKGRPCKFDKVPSHGRMGPGFAALHGHKALNRIVQGSSADETKLALINAERAGLRPTLQVHDEIDASVPSQREAEALAEIMKTAIPKQVPTLVDIELGSSWGDSMKEAAESRKLSGINW